MKTEIDRAASPGKTKVILLDLWKTVARGPYPEPIRLLKDLLELPDSVSDEDFLVDCLTTPHTDPEAYLDHIAQRYGVTVTQDMREEFVQLVENEKNGLLLYTDVQESLRELKALGYRLGIVTNSWPFPVEQFVQQAGLSGIIEHVVCSAIYGVAKQDGPELYLVAAQMFGVNPDECLMVGDNPNLDVIPAQMANVQTVLIDRDGTYIDRKGQFKNPSFQGLDVDYVRNLQELIQRLR